MEENEPVWLKFDDEETVFDWPEEVGRGQDLWRKWHEPHLIGSSSIARFF
jgi:hypothetical protein